MVTDPRLRLCLHPVCRSRGIQGPHRGLCHECYKTCMHVIAVTPRMTDEQMVQDGKLLPRKLDCERDPNFEYGERSDWFQSGSTIPYKSQEQKMWDLVHGVVRKVKDRG